MASREAEGETDMMNVRIDPRSRMPLWAVFGAPLVGVPILVGLLVLGAHPRPVDDVAPAHPIEHVEASGDLHATVETPQPGDSRG